VPAAVGPAAALAGESAKTKAAAKSAKSSPKVPPAKVPAPKPEAAKSAAAKQAAGAKPVVETSKSAVAAAARAGTATKPNDISSYSAAVRWLLERADVERMRVVKYTEDTFKLDRMQALLQRLGNPHQQFRSVHVTGTNGKGSTTAMIAAMLQECGYAVGLYTSPHLVDLRERSSTIKNQEILTGDKVSVRLSLLVSFRVTDPKAALLNVTNYEDRLYEDVQLSARRFLATRSLDQILKDRNELSEAIQSDISGPAMRFGVTVLRADVKDIIFPGQLRELMNKVIETERQAEANLIAAKSRAEIAGLDAQSRAQVASVEAKTALEHQQQKLELDQAFATVLEQNPSLVRVKELEAFKDLGQAAQTHFYVGVDRLKRDA
jgi:regulator of protease activity HflC (stomatin/prohibitin superfamily)